MVRAAALAAALAIAGCGSEPSRARPEPRGVVVWAVGDAATPGDAARAVARRIRASRVDRLLYLGDVYERGTASEFRRFYEPLYGALAERTAPVAGNHDYPGRRGGYEPYWRAKVGRTPRPWYALRAGGWELLALSSEAPHGPGSRQVRWLRARVRERTTCRIAFWHRPRLSAGKHGDQPDTAPLWDALGGRAVAVLSGHDHGLQRFHPVDGIVQLVSGAGGRGLYPIDEGDERLAFADETRFGALRLELRPGTAAYAFVTASGRVLDRGRLRCAAAPDSSQTTS